MATRHRKLSLVLLGIASAFAAAISIWSSPPDRHPGALALVEEGRFRLHKFEQPIGEEKYSLQQDGDELQLSVTFHFNDRGQDVPLDAYVRMAAISRRVRWKSMA